MVIPALGLGAQADANGRYTLVVAAGRVLGQTAQVSALAPGFRARTASITLAPGTIAKDFVCQTATILPRRLVCGVVNPNHH